MPILVWATLWELRGNAQGSSMARWQRVANFLLAIIELFSLAHTAAALLSEIVFWRGVTLSAHFRGWFFVYLLCPQILGVYFLESAMPPNLRQCDILKNFIHQMAIHNATKLLPLTNQTKLTLTITLTLTEYQLQLNTSTRWGKG